MKFYSREKVIAELATLYKQSLGRKIFKQRLQLLTRLQQDEHETAEGDSDLRRELAETLHTEVTLMNPDNFLVCPHRRHLEKLGREEAWDTLDQEDLLELNLHLAGLPAELPREDETARRFDLLLLNLQLALLEKAGSFPRLRDKVVEIAAGLEAKGTIPMVAAQMEMIQEIQTDAWWQDVTLSMLEEVRKRLRLLLVFLDKSQRTTVYTEFTDTIGDATVVYTPATPVPRRCASTG